MSYDCDKQHHGNQKNLSVVNGRISCVLTIDPCVNFVRIIFLIGSKSGGLEDDYIERGAIPTCP